jgi:hypothetical protein
MCFPSARPPLIGIEPYKQSARRDRLQDPGGMSAAAHCGIKHRIAPLQIQRAYRFFKHYRKMHSQTHHHRILFSPGQNTYKVKFFQYQITYSDIGRVAIERAHFPQPFDNRFRAAFASFPSLH